MIKVSVFYPRGENGHFDMEYYLTHHIPMVEALLSPFPGYHGLEVEHGTGGLAPGSAPAILALCHIHFDTEAAFQAAFMPNATAIQADLPHYTNIAPLMQFSEVLLMARGTT